MGRDKVWAQDWVGRTFTKALANWREADAPGLVAPERATLRTMARQMWADAWTVAAEHDLTVGWGLTTFDMAVAMHDLFALASWNQPSPVKKAA